MATKADNSTSNTSSKKKTSKKKIAKKKVTAKKTTKKKTTSAATTKKKAASPEKGEVASKTSFAISAEERWRMIANSAYLKAEARGFTPGHETEDWLQAEKEVDTLLYGKSKK
ncbi:DUF2934 domain-containing protein [Kaarinaea lacus]